jgi:hypothetical protein
VGARLGLAVIVATSALPQIVLVGASGQDPQGLLWLFALGSLVILTVPLALGSSPWCSARAGRPLRARRSTRRPSERSHSVGEDLARIQEGVEHPGDLALQLPLILAELVDEPAALEHADPVLAGEGAAEAQRRAEQLVGGAPDDLGNPSPSKTKLGCRLPSPAWQTVGITRS